MQINLHFSIESSKLAAWAAENLNLAGLGWNQPTADAIDSLMASNPAFRNRIASLYLSSQGIHSPEAPVKKKRL